MIRLVVLAGATAAAATALLVAAVVAVAVGTEFDWEGSE